MLIITDGLPRNLGYYEIDQRATELPIGLGMGSHFEGDTYTCSHCETVVVLNHLRKRERYKCVTCNHHICDNCAAEQIGKTSCVPYKRKVEQYFENLAKQVASGQIIS